MILTMSSFNSLNALAILNQNAIDCNSKKGTTNTLAGNFNYGGIKCEDQNGGTASLIGIKPNDTANKPAVENSNAIDCNSKKGTTNTLAGNFNYGGIKCEDQNGGTASAGAIKSVPNSIAIHGFQSPNDKTRFGGVIRR